MDITYDNGATVPMTILTGFLGAGKTTLLNRILTGNHGLRVGVLVNDFGAINIDAEPVVGVDANMISLANGCVCCQIRDDLTESVIALLARPETVEYILLEASGVADPAGSFMTLAIPANRTDRDDQLRWWCLADDPAAVEPPLAEEFTTGHLGTGLRVIRYRHHDDGALYAALRYAWRSEEFETDLVLNVTAEDLSRLNRAIGDIEDFAHAIRIVPQPAA